MGKKLFYAIVAVLCLSIAYLVLPARIPGTQAYYEANKVELVNKIYKRLYDVAGFKEMPPIFLVSTPEVNAWTDGSSIVVTTALLDFLENENELALIIAHEMSHDILAQTTDGTIQNQPRMEENADRLGSFLMMQAGYDLCSGREFMQRFYDTYGEPPASDIHPPWVTRYKLVDVFCSKAEITTKPSNSVLFTLLMLQ